MPRELGIDEVGTSGQYQSDVEVTSSRERAIDNAARGVVAPHCVDCNTHSVVVGRWLFVVGPQSLVVGSGSFRPTTNDQSLTTNDERPTTTIPRPRPLPAGRDSTRSVDRRGAAAWARDNV